ncbi:AAA family ATPase [Psychrobacter sp. DAB_AL32B]|uniref:AAA family ATPase n=1 Tax=Psychrobacter sp. DAB_AL32B TaxID=1028414 RepID=UPI000B800B06|nr:AAA family ATPase [Psychrobacter sp. DAB_AL32B]OXL24625.1 hypothetical protein CAN34_05590 [Psychrobacter sp. DAB_AL32B]
MNIINFKSLFVYSEDKEVCFYQTFNKRVNIVSGCNTSGKSTLIQSFLYALGINDIKEKLSEVLDMQPVFRLDFTLENEDELTNYILIRDDGTIYLKKNDERLISFYGVGANTGRERTKFKNYLSNIFGFNMYVEYRGDYITAPLEAFYLPYYVSQSVGWVYLQESFSNFQFYKDFRRDYLDYYLGISTNWDREELIALNKQRNELNTEIKLLDKQKSSTNFEIAKNVDEAFGVEAQEYINDYVELYRSLQEAKTNLIKNANQLAIYENHLKIVRKTKSNIKHQKFDSIDSCPACLQTLHYSLERIYEYHQKKNDNLKIEEHLKDKLKVCQSKINSYRSKIEELEENIQKRYSVLEKIEHLDIDYNTWIEIKADARQYNNLTANIFELNSKLEDTKKKLNNFDETKADSLRAQKANKFSRLFKKALSDLEVKPLEEDRYLDIYRINSFPYQGVELHSTMLAYHLCFNKIILETDGIHRLPLLLDGVLKEDIDPSSLVKIFKFIGKNLPKDTQSFISVSDYRASEDKIDGSEVVMRFAVEDIKEEYFDEESEIIYISDNKKKRVFLSQFLDKKLDIYQDTINILST